MDKIICKNDMTNIAFVWKIIKKLQTNYLEKWDIIYILKISNYLNKDW